MPHDAGSGQVAVGVLVVALVVLRLGCAGLGVLTGVTNLEV